MQTQCSHFSTILSNRLLSSPHSIQHTYVHAHFPPPHTSFTILLIITPYEVYASTHTRHRMVMMFEQHAMMLMMNRQARVVLEDRMKYSLQLTALRLNPRRLRGVQALT